MPESAGRKKERGGGACGGGLALAARSRDWLVAGKA